MRWLVSDVSVTTDCTGTVPGPDGVPCEVGGWGPDFYGYFYSAAFMADVRTNCPASCGMCDGPTWLFSSVPDTSADSTWIT